MTKTIERKCKTCRFLKVPPNRAGVRVVRQYATFHCDAPLPESVNIPDSVTKGPWYTPFETAPRRRMTGKDGTTCPAWQPLESLETETTHVAVEARIFTMDAFDAAIAGKTVHVLSSAPTQTMTPTTHKRAREIAAQWIDNPTSIGWPVGVFIETLSRDDCLMSFRVVVVPPQTQPKEQP